MKIGYFLKLLMDFGIKQSEIAEKNEMTQNDLDNEWFNNWIDEGDNDLLEDVDIKGPYAGAIFRF